MTGNYFAVLSAFSSRYPLDCHSLINYTNPLRLLMLFSNRPLAGIKQLQWYRLAHNKALCFGLPMECMDGPDPFTRDDVSIYSRESWFLNESF